jgi:chemotaxis protein MotB
MAGMDDKIIIIRRIKKGGHGHHGGAWKVAYADFVTAMMAFFLLLWLLNVTTDVERKGIADYFAPASISKSDSGAGGTFGGQTITAPGAQISDSSPPGSSKAIPEPDASEEGRKDTPGAGSPSGPKKDVKGDVTSGSSADVPAAIAELQKEVKPENTTPPDAGKMDAKKIEDEKKKEEEFFKRAETALREAIKSVPGLSGLDKNLIIDSTQEGLRIQIVDRDGYSLFQTGNARLDEKGAQLVRLVGLVLARLPNKITVTGHTDNTAFPIGSRRNNWELSSGRAQASLAAIMAAGVAGERVMGVIGKADRDPLIKDDPKNPQNRRISIVLLRRFTDKQNEMTPTQTQSEQPPEHMNNVPAVQSPPATEIINAP